MERNFYVLLEKGKEIKNYKNDHEQDCRVNGGATLCMKSKGVGEEGEKWSMSGSDRGAQNVSMSLTSVYPSIC